MEKEKKKKAASGGVSLSLSLFIFFFYPVRFENVEFLSGRGHAPPKPRPLLLGAVKKMLKKKRKTSTARRLFPVLDNDVDLSIDWRTSFFFL